jgi:2-polyprenyl-3-methyl-5-hydroxy-6-metoxy-1,4-benzoquinol methylase
VDCVWQGDFLAQPIDARFDCVTFLDVIEHAAVPLPWLERARSLLNPGGCIVASIPNVGHWSVVADLLEGRWDYAPVGIHCITHLRFYTRHGIEALMNEAGLRITQMKATQVPMPAWMDGVTHLPGLRVDQTSLDAYNWLLCAEPC